MEEDSCTNETSANCSLQNSVDQNTENISTIQGQITSILSNVQEISGNVVNLQNQVNGLSNQQASLISGAQPANITGT
jgi:prophage DNA circulation protein